MFQDRYDVTTVIYAHLILSDSTTTDVAIELGFRASDPYSVEAELTANDVTSTWLLARDLLVAGLGATEDAVAGEGDVQVWRDQDPEYLLVTLSGAGGTALIATGARDVERFLVEARALVPIGTEGSRVDAAFEAFVTSLLTA
jgi:hypothetical protein